MEVLHVTVAMLIITSAFETLLSQGSVSLQSTRTVVSLIGKGAKQYVRTIVELS